MIKRVKRLLFAAVSGRRLTVGVFCLTCFVFYGCDKSNVGVFSHNEYAYSADTPDTVAKARARFDSAIEFFKSAGFTVKSVTRADKRCEGLLNGPGTEAGVTLFFPDNGLATITLSYKFEGAGTEAKQKAESMLADAQRLLAPEQPARPPSS